MKTHVLIVVGLMTAGVFAFSPTVSASHLCVDPGDDEIVVPGYFESPVVMVATMVISRTFTCTVDPFDSTIWTLSSTATGASGVGTITCTKQIDSDDNVITSGTGSANELLIFSDGTSGGGGGCDVWPEYTGDPYFWLGGSDAGFLERIHWNGVCPNDLLCEIL